MPALTFALERGGPQRLVVAWQGLWEQGVVRLDGQLLGRFGSEGDLRKGRLFKLADGSALLVQLKRNLFAKELHVSLNGEPIPGSANDPALRWSTAYQYAMVLGLLDVVSGAAAEIFNVDFLHGLGIGVHSIFFGLMMVFCGWLAQRRSVTALVFVCLLFALDGAIGFNQATQLPTGRQLIISFLIRLILLIPMIQGIPALMQLKRNEQSEPSA